MTTRCTHCGATLTWYAGRTWQVCWSCAKVTKRVPDTLGNPQEIGDIVRSCWANPPNALAFYWTDSGELDSNPAWWGIPPVECGEGW